MGRRPDKKELAKIKVMSDLGLAPTNIAQKIGRSHHMVIKYLGLPETFEDLEVKQLVEAIKEKELSDLHLLGAKARKRLHELLDEGETKMIETCAVMDRSFQQRRLLEGQSTSNIAYADALKAREEAKLSLDNLRKIRRERYPEFKASEEEEGVE